MSSGISIEEGRLPPAPTPQVEAGSSRPGDGFQPWHFFVLASIVLATVAVVVTRSSWAVPSLCLFVRRQREFVVVCADLARV